MNKWFAPGRRRASRAATARAGPREVEPSASADGRCDYLTTFGDRFPVAGFLASMGLPQDDADFFVECVRLMSGGTDSADAARAR